MNEILAEIRDLLAAQNEASNLGQRLWTAEDVANYGRYSVHTVLNRITKLPDFPRAIKPPTSEKGGQPRWVGSEVKAWFAKHREAK